METGTHSIWVSEQLQEMGHEVLIVANVKGAAGDLCTVIGRATPWTPRRSLGTLGSIQKILRPISHRTVAQQEALTLIRARNLIVRLRTAAVNSVRGLAKPTAATVTCQRPSTLCFAKRSLAVLPRGLLQALGLRCSNRSRR